MQLHDLVVKWLPEPTEKSDFRSTAEKELSALEACFVLNMQRKPLARLERAHYFYELCVIGKQTPKQLAEKLSPGVTERDIQRDIGFYMALGCSLTVELFCQKELEAKPHTMVDETFVCSSCGAVFSYDLEKAVNTLEMIISRIVNGVGSVFPYDYELRGLLVTFDYYRRKLNPQIDLIGVRTVLTEETKKSLANDLTMPRSLSLSPFLEENEEGEYKIAFHNNQVKAALKTNVDISVYVITPSNQKPLKKKLSELKGHTIYDSLGNIVQQEGNSE